MSKTTPQNPQRQLYPFKNQTPLKHCYDIFKWNWLLANIHSARVVLGELPVVIEAQPAATGSRALVGDFRSLTRIYPTTSQLIARTGA